MRKLLVAVLVIAGIFAGRWAGNAVTQNSQLADPGSVKAETVEPVKEQKLTVFNSPKRLSIPKINVLSDVEEVGEDEKGNMDVPKKVENVGWYKFGFKAGQKGSVVLAGHLDDVNGDPAVFWDLNKLEAGDEIILTDEMGKEWTYVVTRNVTYPYDQFPLQEVFAKDDNAYLNLITCEGSFDQSSKNYSHRTVVYSKLSK